MNLLSPSEAARILRVSRSTVAALVRDESLPCVVLRQTGAKRIIRFDEHEIEEWLANRRHHQLVGLVDGSRYAKRTGAA